MNTLPHSVALGSSWPMRNHCEAAALDRAPNPGSNSTSKTVPLCYRYHAMTAMPRAPADHRGVPQLKSVPVVDSKARRRRRAVRTCRYRRTYVPAPIFSRLFGASCKCAHPRITSPFNFWDDSVPRFPALSPRPIRLPRSSWILLRGITTGI